MLFRSVDTLRRNYNATNSTMTRYLCFTQPAVVLHHFLFDNVNIRRTQMHIIIMALCLCGWVIMSSPVCSSYVPYTCRWMCCCRIVSTPHKMYNVSFSIYTNEKKNVTATNVTCTIVMHVKYKHFDGWYHFSLFQNLSVRNINNALNFKQWHDMVDWTQNGNICFTHFILLIEMTQNVILNRCLFAISHGWQRKVLI